MQSYRDVLRNGQIGEEGKVLKDHLHAKPAALNRRQMRIGVTFDDDATAWVGIDHARDDLDHRRLAGTVAANEAVNLPLFKLDAYRLGAFTHPDPKTRRAAIDLTKRGLDSLASVGGKLMTLWMGQDGFDYSFQADYRRLWDRTIEAMREVADHNPQIDIGIEYKPNEPRSFSLMPDVATTLLAIRDIGRPNLGVTLDFAHVLFADEMPAYAAALVSKFSRLLGVHLNDGYGKRDDGLMVGAVHPIQTLELLYALSDAGYEGAIYFDTFPDTAGMDPIAECACSIATVAVLRQAAAKLKNDAALRRAIEAQDAVTAQGIVRAALYGS